MPKLAEFSFSEEKDQKLRAERGIGFKEIIACIESGQAVDDFDNPNRKNYAGQRIYAVNIEDYIWMVPYRVERSTVHLITAFPSRKGSKAYGKEKK